MNDLFDKEKENLGLKVKLGDRRLNNLTSIVVETEATENESKRSGREKERRAGVNRREECIGRQ